MRGIKALDREAIVVFLVGRGFDKDVLDLCSKEWLLEILERQIVPEIPEEEEPEEEEELTNPLEDKAALRRELELAVKEFLASGRSVTCVPQERCKAPGEAGQKWAREVWPDD